MQPESSAGEETLSHFVSRALEIELAPRSIESVSKHPRAVIRTLRAAYASSGPVAPPPREPQHTRPYASPIFSGEVRGAPDAFPPELRAEMAKRLLVYHHEVCIDDPVQWFMGEEDFRGGHEQQFHTRDGVRRLLTAVADVAPLLDSGLIHTVRSESLLLNKYERKAARRLTKSMRKHPTGTDFELMTAVFESLKLRHVYGGTLDLYLPWGGQVLQAIRSLHGHVPVGDGWGVAAVRPVQTMVLLPDVGGLKTTDMIELRAVGAIDRWLTSLSEAVRAFENALASGNDLDATVEFRGTLQEARDNLKAELSLSAIAKRSWIRGRRQFGIGAAGVIGLAATDWEEFVGFFLGVAGQGTAEAGLEVATGWRERRRSLPILPHFTTFLAGQAGGD